jgi:hypothetical protein
MSEKFTQINERARVDNYLSGTTHAPPEPQNSATGAVGAVRQDRAVLPTAGAR